jgi:hypothetical protein
MRSMRALMLSFGLCAVVLPLAARAQEETREEIAMQDQILELRHDLDQLRAQMPARRGPRGRPM